MKTDPDYLSALRGEMARLKLDAYLVPRGDEYLGEYVPEEAERLHALCGFDGSAGLLVVTKQEAVLFTDSRYTLQAADQLDPERFQCFDTAQTKPGAWLKTKIPADGRVGYDPALFSPEQIETIEDTLFELAENTLVAVDQNLVDVIWSGKPARLARPAVLFPEKLAGKSAAQKVTEAAEALRDAECHGFIVTQPDSIAWLLNMRGSDLEHLPVVLSYAILRADPPYVEWFADSDAITDEVRQALSGLVSFHTPDALQERIGVLATEAQKKDKSIGLDPKRASLRFFNMLEGSQAKIAEMTDPCIAPRACKTEAERRAIRRAHREDGVAVTRFLYWLDTHPDPAQLTELDVVGKLHEFRSICDHFRGASFATIAGAGPNGAIIHYRATERSNRKLQPGSLLLLDSGGQYCGPDYAGTTDITRTVAIGTPGAEMRKHYTLVLKAHLALAAARFPEGTDGKTLDAIARAPLQAAGLDYGHGTGHGVGCYLSVHEAPASLSPRAEGQIVKPGMVLSNEPGFYLEGKYGIRIENLVLVTEGEGKGASNTPLLVFNDLTCVPYDPDLIVPEMLTESELARLNTYHRIVQEKIGLSLQPEEQEWLRAQCRPIGEFSIV